ncbi:MAG: hypothetical protein ACRD4P_06220 [Bryobacteraceae bacterium]
MKHYTFSKSHTLEDIMAAKPDNEVKAMEAAFNALASLNPDERRRVLVWLWEKLEVGVGQPASFQPLAAAPAVALASGHTAPAGAAGNFTAKAFVAQKDPRTDAERVTCLAYYLTHYKATPRFKTKQLAAANLEAAQPKFSNPAVAVMNAAGSKYLSPAGGGDKQITVWGEKLVDALPDREKVNALRKPRRRNISKKN